MNAGSATTTTDEPSHRKSENTLRVAHNERIARETLHLIAKVREEYMVAVAINQRYDCVSFVVAVGIGLRICDF